MKKLTKKSVLILGLFVTMFTSVYAEVNPIKENEPKVTSIDFKKVQPGSKLSIKDARGSVLYKESIVKTGDYSKGFDLTSLPNGNYYFELDTKLEILIIYFQN